jgi:hypothetical protein
MYETLADLINAYHSHALDRDDAVLYLDNDDSGVYSGGVKVFSMDPHELLRQALDLLQIPHEPV